MACSPVLLAPRPVRLACCLWPSFVVMLDRAADVPAERLTWKMNELLRDTIGLEVREARAFGENNCLIDSALQALLAQGFLRRMGEEEMQMLCSRARQYLVQRHGLAPCGSPMLEHDGHFECICEFVRENLVPDWRGPASLEGTAMDCVVYDRWQGVHVQNQDGSWAAAIPEPLPARPEAPSGIERSSCLVVLCCNTYTNARCGPEG